MHMRDDSGDRPSPTPGQLGTPRGGIEMLQEDLIHSLVYRVALHHHLARIEFAVSL
jgi:hypothetical protein